MKPLYLRKEGPGGTRKIMLDMAFVSSNKKIRFPKYLMEEGLYLPYLPDKNDRNKIEKYIISKEQAKKEDEHFYYFHFPFKAEQVEDIAS